MSRDMQDIQVQQNLDKWLAELTRCRAPASFPRPRHPFRVFGKLQHLKNNLRFCERELAEAFVVHGFFTDGAGRWFRVVSTSVSVLDMFGVLLRDPLDYTTGAHVVFMDPRHRLTLQADPVRERTLRDGWRQLTSSAASPSHSRHGRIAEHSGLEMKQHRGFLTLGVPDALRRNFILHIIFHLYGGASTVLALHSIDEALSGLRRVAIETIRHPHLPARSLQMNFSES
ncbi:hypothetical protein B0H13DRAFT_2328874 [Mycena leptocephala]|nr:hypothetical protein B0H13DRAFT_2328874 [Mycena leptocephala]